MERTSSTLEATEQLLRPLVLSAGIICTALGVTLLISSFQVAVPWLTCFALWAALICSNAICASTNVRLSVGLVPVFLASLAPAALACLVVPSTSAIKTALATVLLVSSMAIVCLFIFWFVRIRQTYARHIPVADDAVVMVLGGAVRADEPSPTLVCRLNTALELAREHPQRTFVLTGGPTSTGELTEAEVMAAYLLRCGISQDQLVLETKARNTRENIECSLALLADDGRKRQLCVLTSSYHLYRALGEGAKLGVRMVPIPAPVPPTGKLQQWCREVLTILYESARGV